jgi:hypothetical protein
MVSHNTSSSPPSTPGTLGLSGTPVRPGSKTKKSAPSSALVSDAVGAATDSARRFQSMQANIESTLVTAATQKESGRSEKGSAARNKGVLEAAK